MARLILLFLFNFLFLASFAQENDTKKSKRELRREKIDEIARQEEEGVIKFRRHTVFGGKLTTDGYGGFLEFGRARSTRKSLLFQVELTERKHVKEIKGYFAQFQATPIIYGKINYFYPLKLGAQMQYLLGNKSNKNGVSISTNFGGGISLGLLRPYTIQINDGNSLKNINYYQDSASFLNPGLFHRGPGFFTGWSDVKVVPGIYLKPSIRFDYGKFNEMVNAIEVGLTGEFFTKDIEQMAFIKKDKFFLGGYVALMIGRRKQ